MYVLHMNASCSMHLRMTHCMTPPVEHNVAHCSTVQKVYFCTKISIMIQLGPEGSKIYVKNQFKYFPL